MIRPLILAIACVSATAHAQPWSEGVSEEQMARARALFDEGTRYFDAKDYPQAVAKYRAAVADWDHPRIWFNLARALIELREAGLAEPSLLLEAADAVERSLRHGDAPFGEDQDNHERALHYRTLLEANIATIEVACEQRDVQLLLDGRPWFTCPGTQKVRVLAGEHAIVGERVGYQTVSRRVVVAGGTTMRETVALAPIVKAYRDEYRFRRWIPWTAIGTGIAVGAAGVGVWRWGEREMADFDREFLAACETGCDLQADTLEARTLQAKHDAAERKGTIGVSLMVAGGAVTVGGIVLALLNRPRQVEVTPLPGGISASVMTRF